MLSRTQCAGHVVRFPSPFVLSLILSHVEGLPFVIIPFRAPAGLTPKHVCVTISFVKRGPKITNGQTPCSYRRQAECG